MKVAFEYVYKVDNLIYTGWIIGNDKIGYTFICNDAIREILGREPSKRKIYMFDLVVGDVVETDK